MISLQYSGGRHAFAGSAARGAGVKNGAGLSRRAGSASSCEVGTCRRGRWADGGSTASATLASDEEPAKASLEAIRFMICSFWFAYFAGAAPLDLACRGPVNCARVSAARNQQWQATQYLVSRVGDSPVSGIGVKRNCGVPCELPRAATVRGLTGKHRCCARRAPHGE